jgi:hypothetical protein
VLPVLAPSYLPLPAARRLPSGDQALPAPDPPTFGGEIRYDGQRLDPLTGKLISFTPGEPPNMADPSAPGKIYVPANVHFTLNWQVLAPPSADWVVFVHLLNEAGELLLQSDVGAEWPVQPCAEGEYGPECNATTEHEWTFPADFPAGLYTIVVGLYDPASGMRAPVSSPAESTASQQVVLGQVQVLPEPAPAYTQATLHIYSGRPNPTWTLTPAQDAELRQRLGALQPTGQAFDEMGRLGYAGFDLLLPYAQGQPEQYVQVWDGILDDDPPGVCAAQFPVYGTSRIVAGGPFKGSIFKCQLQSVAAAIADGAYGAWTPTLAEQSQLEQIFPDGVCDYSLPDAGLPPGW